MNYINILEIIGTIAFSISGALVATENGLDIFGVVALGLTTATGGGIIRDIIIGKLPVTIFSNPQYIIISLLVSLITFLPFFRKILKKGEKGLLVMDCIGLSTFTVVGTIIGIAYNNSLLAIFTGLLTAVGGGVLRDLFSGCKPNIFVRHFYACASLIGAIFVCIIYPLNSTIAIVGGLVLVFVLRIVAALNEWNLPKPKRI